MKFEDKTINSIGELIDAMKENIGDYVGPVWFRGQSKSKWHLEPRLMRENNQISENYLVNRFKQNATFILNHQPKSEFDWLFLMQHHSTPTRLLDWSESPLSAIYFSVDSNIDDEGALWLLLPCFLNEKSNYRPDFEFEIPSFEDEHMQNYLPTTIARERSSKLFPMAAIAPRNSSRMQAQQGVFTISHRENIFIEDVGHQGTPKNYIWRYLIPSAKKEQIRKELKLLGISRFQLFPELESLSYGI